VSYVKVQATKKTLRRLYEGSMTRSFFIGENVKEEDVRAKFEDGVLTLDFPKEKPVLTRRPGWVHRAKEEFESEEGKEILKKLGIEGNYEGIGNLILGYVAKPAGEAAPRKANYVYRV